MTAFRGEEAMRKNVRRPEVDGYRLWRFLAISWLGHRLAQVHLFLA
jgi:hypothetical protein